MTAFLAVLACGPDGSEDDPVGAPEVALTPVTCDAPDGREVAAWDRIELDLPPSPTLGLEHGGVVLADIDGDDIHELLAVGSEPALLRFRDGRVERMLEALDGIDLAHATGGSAADYDGDGDLDLLVTRYGAPLVLLRNDNARMFDASGVSRLERDARHATSSSWGDWDRDGDLDLAVGAWGDPEADVAGGVALWRNNGDGTFSDASTHLPVEVRDAWVFALAWLDLDQDGFPELVSVHDAPQHQPSVLLDNPDGADLVVDVNSAFHPNFVGMGVGVGDVDGNGLPDLVETSMADIALMTGIASDLAASGVAFVDKADAVGLVAPDTLGWASHVADPDNDGDADVLATFGLWDEVSGAPGPENRVELFENDGGTFASVGDSAWWGLTDVGSGRGAQVADIDADGWVDAVFASVDEPWSLYRSRCGEAAWLHLHVRDPDGANVFGVGARVRVRSGDRWWGGWVMGGGTGMFGGGPPEVHLGLGDLDAVEEIEVVWPDGGVDLLPGVATRQHVVITRR